VLIQVIMVAAVILIPSMVMVYKAGAVKLNEQQIEEQFKNIAPPPGADLPPPLKF
jgi:hypothetical protein